MFPGGYVLKRSFDILLSSALLVLVLPAVLVAALAIRLTSPGPVLFRQLRAGRRFRSFHILKLRTMRVDLPGHAYTLGPDPRITPVGAFLRRTKIDELPQLWNVLRGDMSVVGPRPVRPELAREFRSHYNHLLRVRPGLTDPASVKYFRETDILAQHPDPLTHFKSVVTPDKIRISLDYLDRSTPLNDLKWVGHTAIVCIISGIFRLTNPAPQFLSLCFHRQPASHTRSRTFAARLTPDTISPPASAYTLSNRIRGLS